jgi:hypothetical protein
MGTMRLRHLRESAGMEQILVAVAAQLAVLLIDLAIQVIRQQLAARAVVA